jgi:hypothetical protein
MFVLLKSQKQDIRILFRLLNNETQILVEN